METREQQTLKALSGLQLAYSKEFDKNRLLFYVKMLSDIDPKILEKAATKLVNTSKFLPAISEIREAADGLSAKLDGTRMKDADEAWAEVTAEVRRAFVYNKPVFSTPEIAETVKCIGWLNLCNRQAKDEGIFHAQFRDAYKQACTRHKNDAIDRKLGVYEVPLLNTQENKMQRIGSFSTAGDVIARNHILQGGKS